MNDYATASDRIFALQREIDESDDLALKLEFAKTLTLLSISQELSALNPQNTKTRGPQGEWVNGWGLPVGPHA